MNAIGASSVRLRVPLIGMMELADAGGLLGFGVDFLDQFRHAAYFVDRILKGDKPENLPIEQPTQLSLVVNLRTAETFGLKLPASIRIRANRVIE